MNATDFAPHVPRRPFPDRRVYWLAQQSDWTRVVAPCRCYVLAAPPPRRTVLLAALRERVRWGGRR